MVIKPSRKLSVKKDPEQQPPVPQQDTFRKQLKKERIVWNESVVQVWIFVEKEAAWHNSGGKPGDKKTRKEQPPVPQQDNKIHLHTAHIEIVKNDFISSWINFNIGVLCIVWPPSKCPVLLTYT